MNDPVHFFTSVILIGIGATLAFDLWGLFLNQAFKITPSNMCLVGRWIRYLPEGILKHSNIGSAQLKDAECLTGWAAHYMTGITFALIFVGLVGNSWLQHPTPLPAILFGVMTVAAPFFIMQPAFGLGIAASKAANPPKTRIRSLMNHAVFGIGLYVFGLLAA